MPYTIVDAIGCTLCSHVVINPEDPNKIFEDHNAYHGFQVENDKRNIVQRMSFLNVDAVTNDVVSVFNGFTVVEELASL
jgi:hypothetical protein